jgi:hypothetical protein
MHKRFVFTVLLGLATAASSAFANDIHKNLDAQAILAQQQQIRADVEKRDGRFKDMDAKKREELFVRQGKVASLLAGKKATTELSEQDQIVVFNELEAIEGILNQAEDDRMICQRTKPVGSNRPKTVCMTAAERRAQREAAEKDMSTRNQACLKDANGNCL